MTGQLRYGISTWTAEERREAEQALSKMEDYKHLSNAAEVDARNRAESARIDAEWAERNATTAEDGECVTFGCSTVVHLEFPRDRTKTFCGRDRGATSSVFATPWEQIEGWTSDVTGHHFRQCSDCRRELARWNRPGAVRSFIKSSFVNG